MVLRENCPLIPIQKACCSWAAETWPTTRARQQPALKPIICVAQRDSGGGKRENTSIHTCCCRVTWAPLHGQLVRLSINKHHALSLSLGTPCEYQMNSHPSLREHGVQLTEKVLPPHPSEWFICSSPCKCLQGLLTSFAVTCQPRAQCVSPFSLPVRSSNHSLLLATLAKPPPLLWHMRAHPTVTLDSPGDPCSFPSQCSMQCGIKAIWASICLVSASPVGCAQCCLT